MEDNLKQLLKEEKDYRSKNNYQECYIMSFSSTSIPSSFPYLT